MSIALIASGIATFVSLWVTACFWCAVRLADNYDQALRDEIRRGRR